MAHWYTKLFLIGIITQCWTTFVTCLPNYDFIVVGAGAGGGAVARRLAESGRFSVLLVESGGLPGQFNEVPSYAPYARDSVFNFDSIPQRNAALMNNGIVSVLSGRMLGGTTSLNYMWFNRGHPRDWDNWAQVSGDPSWKYENMLKYFRRVETYEGDFPSNVHHGYDGPITVSRPRYAPGLEHWLAAGKELGYPVADPNGPQQRSFSPVEYSKRRGRRVSSFTGYLNGKLETANLKVLINTNVTRVVFEGKRAIGVRFATGTVAYANKEVIISAGAYNSPLILQRSGIGPANILRPANIPIVKELPVGLNLQQHAAINLNFAIRNISNIVFDEGKDLTEENWEFWKAYGDGPFSGTTGATGQAMVCSSVAAAEGDFEWPDMQIAMSHSTLPYLDTNDLHTTLNLSRGEVSMSGSVWLGRAKSRGSIRINPRDPLANPILDMGYLNDARDMQIILDGKIPIGIRELLNVFEKTKSYQSLGARYAPVNLPACQNLPMKSRQYWICYVRQTLQGGCHPAGTNKMGRVSDPSAVVDNELRVIGIDGLRVVDASVMPFITNANPQASIYGIAERASALILRKWGSEVVPPEIYGGHDNVAVGVRFPSQTGIETGRFTLSSHSRLEQLYAPIL